MSRLTIRELIDTKNTMSSGRYIVVRTVQTACICTILLVLAKIVGCSAGNDMLCKNIGILEIGGLCAAIAGIAGATKWGDKREEVKKEVAINKENNGDS